MEGQRAANKAKLWRKFAENRLALLANPEAERKDERLLAQALFGCDPGPGHSPITEIVRKVGFSHDFLTALTEGTEIDE